MDRPGRWWLRWVCRLIGHDWMPGPGLAWDCDWCRGRCYREHLPR